MLTPEQEELLKDKEITLFFPNLNFAFAFSYPFLDELKEAIFTRAQEHPEENHIKLYQPTIEIKEEKPQRFTVIDGGLSKEVR